MKGSGEQGLSISRIFPFPAKEYVPLVGPLEQGATSLFATLRCEWKEERRGEGQMDLSAWLSPEGSEEREPVELKLLESVSRDEADFYLLEFELPDLPPGRYRLEIQAEDMVKGSIVRTTGSFTVR